MGQRRGTASVELYSASCCAWERKEEEGEGGKGRREKKKREKEKGKGKRKMERERDRVVGGIRGGGRPRARCGVWPVSDEHVEREKGKGDWYWCRNGGSLEKDFGESGARTVKNLE